MKFPNPAEPAAEAGAVPENLAPITSRILGKLIDGLVLSPIVLLAVSQSGAFNNIGKSGATTHLSSGLLATIYLITGAYEISLTALRGQTVGCMAMKIRIQDARSGRVPRWGQAGIRWLVPMAVSFIPVIGVFLTLVVYGTMFWDRRRQGLHDKAAGVLVVKVPIPA
ncbi:MAG: RDD family protein [Acidimicrobiales bacterium]